MIAAAVSAVQSYTCLASRGLTLKLSFRHVPVQNQMRILLLRGMTLLTSFFFLMTSMPGRRHTAGACGFSHVGPRWHRQHFAASIQVCIFQRGRLKRHSFSLLKKAWVLTLRIWFAMHALQLAQAITTKLLGRGIHHNTGKVSGMRKCCLPIQTSTLSGYWCKLCAFRCLRSGTLPRSGR